MADTNVIDIQKGTADIHGNDYKLVVARVQEFRTNPVYKNFEMETFLVEHDADHCIMRAEIRKPDGRIYGSGFAHEFKTANKINRTAMIENCETSAIGRALASIGIAGQEYASFEEIERAKARAAEAEQQPKEQPDPYREALNKVYELTKFNPQTQELHGTILEVKKATEWLSANCEPSIVKKVRPTLDAFAESLKEATAIE